MLCCLPDKEGRMQLARRSDRTEVVTINPLTKLQHVIEGITPDDKVARALADLERAREARREHETAQRRLIAKNIAMPDSVTSIEIAPVTARYEAAQRLVDQARVKLREALVQWAPQVRRQLAPHRAQAAAKIVAAVDQIETAYSTLGTADRYLMTWSLEPEPRLDQRDLKALRYSAEKIAASAG
jgi:hypothetical protein